MDWVKKNLALVIAGAVALVLLGASGFFLYSNLTKEKEIDAQIAEKMTAKEGLSTANPHPNDANIKLAKADQARLADLLSRYRKFFTPFTYPKVSDSLEFKTMLAVTVDQLQREAKASGVIVQSNYLFSFESQRRPTQFESTSLQPLTERLVEVRALCDVLFKSNIRMLETVQRPVVSRSEDTVSSDLISAAPVTNSLGVSVPYQVSFVTYASQLSEVLNGLAQSPHCFVVKSINVVTNAPISSSTAAAAAAQAVAVPGAGAGESASSEARMRARYGARYGGGASRMLGGEGAATAPVVQQVAPAARRGPEKVVEEVPIKVTLRVDIVKLTLPTEEAQPRSTARAAR